MKLSNFELIKTKGTNAIDLVYFAEVDVTTGFCWPFKKTVRREVFRSYASFWFFTDTGEWTPSDDCEKLARAYTAKTGEKC
jgi:hypothetical protein